VAKPVTVKSWTPDLEGQSCLAGESETSNLEHFRNQSAYPWALFTSVGVSNRARFKAKASTFGLPAVRTYRKALPKKASERTFNDDEVVLPDNLDGYEFRDAPGISQRVDDVLGSQFSHDQRQVAFEGGLDGASIDPLHIFSGASTTNHFHHKFCVLHSLLYCMEVLLRRNRNTGDEGVTRRRGTGFQLRVSQASRCYLDDIRLGVGSRNHVFSIDDRQESYQR
jgi:hypothetical protein